MVWIQLGIALVLFVIGELLRKPPPDAVAANFEDFGFPSVDPTKRINVFWGKKRISSVHTLDVQGYRTRKIKVKSGLFSKTTVGHKYYAGLDISVARGSSAGVTLKKILYDNQVLWEGTASPTDAGVAIAVNLPQFFNEEEGIGGTVRWYGGLPTQNINTWFDDKHTADPAVGAGFTPAYRHVAHAAFEDFYWGNQPVIRQLEFVCERYPNTLGLDGARTVNTTANESPTEGAVDLAIPEIINEILTDGDWGLAESSVNDIDIASFTDSAGILAAEANAMSLIWSGGDSIEDLLKIVMQQADGFVFKRMSSSLWEMNLARDGYLSGSPINSGEILEFDEDNCSLIRYNRGSWDQTFNIVNLNWSDRNLKGKPAPAHAQDMANFDIQGDRQTANYNFPGCHSSTLANFLASRQLRATSWPLIIAEITTNRLAFDLNPGDIVSFAWAQLGIARVFMRINKISLGTPEQGEIRISLVQDVFGVADTVFAPPQQSLAPPQSSAPINVVTGLISDQPAWMARQDPNNVLGKEGKPYTLMKQPQGNSLEYRVWAKLSTDTNYVDQGEAWAFAAVGTLVNNLPLDPRTLSPTIAATAFTFDEIDVELIDHIEEVSGPNTVTQIKELGAGLILIESSGSPDGHEFEILAYESATITGSNAVLNNVHRAMEDTVPRRCNAGDRVWFMEGETGTTVDVYADSQTVNVRADNVTTRGATGIGSALTFTRAMRRRVDRPFLPGQMRYGTSNQAVDPWPSEVVRFLAGDILFDWKRRDHELVDLQYQEDSDDPKSPLVEYDVDIYSFEGASASFLRTIVSTTATATYTKAQQYSDGVFGRYLIVTRAYHADESPRLVSLYNHIRSFKYDQLLSPLPSPVPIGVSPVSPRPSPHKSPSSPVPSPISPVQSPISPVASPISPLPSPRSPAPSPRSPAPSPRSPAPSPRSPNPSPKSSPTGITPAEHGYRGFILLEAPTAYWTLNDFQTVESPPAPDFSPIASQTFIEEISSITTVSHGSIAAQNRPLTKNNTDFSAGSSGEAGWIEANDDVTYDFSDTWTIEFWFATGLADGANRVIFQRGTGGGNHPIQAYIDGTGVDVGKFVGLFRDADAAPGTTVVSRERLDDGRVHHIIITQDVSGGDAAINLYVDGHLDSASGAEGSPLIGKPWDSSEALLFLGSDDSGEGIRGLMAHVAIYDKVLTVGDALDHYMEGVRWTPFYAKAQKMGLHNWWRMHDIVGDGLCLDWGSLGQDGTMINTPITGAVGPLGGSQASRAITFGDGGSSPMQPSPVGGNVELPNDFIKAGISPVPQTGMFAAWYKRRNLQSPNEDQPVVIVGANATGVVALRLDSATGGWETVMISTASSSTLTVDAKWTAGLDEWAHIAIVADGSSKLQFYSNGVAVPPADVSQALGGTGANSDWIGDVVANSGAEPWSWHIGVSVFNVVAASPGDTDGSWKGELAEVMFLHDVVPTDADMLELYTSGLAAFDSMTEALRQTDPYHLVEISDGTTNRPDEMDNIADGVWAGTRIESQLPMAADDDAYSVYLTRTARTYLEWASDSWMSSLSDVTSPLGVMPKAHSIVITYSREEIQGSAAADNMMLITNTNSGDTALNLIVEAINNGIVMDVFPPSAKWLTTKNQTVQAGRNEMVAFIQNAKVRGSPRNSPEDDSYRRLFLDGDETLYEPISVDDNDRNYVEEYGTGGVNIETRLGDWAANTAGQRNFGGLMGHAAAWSHTISDEIARRMARRMHGYQEFPLMVMQHNPEIYWRMDDPDSAVHLEDHSVNLRHSDNLLGTILLDQADDNSNLHHEDVGVLNTDPGGAAIFEAQVLNVNDAKTVGGWFRVPTDSPITEALVALYDSATTDRFQEFKIFDTAGNYRVAYGASNGATTDTSIGVTNLTAGTWYFIVWVVDALSTTVTTYLNGNVEIAADTVSDITGVTYDRFAVGTREFESPTTTIQNGSYHDVFVINKELTQSEINDIYSRAFVPSYDNLLLSQGPIGYWKLDDGWQVGQEHRFYNSVANAAGHYVYGETIGSPQTLVTGERGFVPNYVGLSTLFNNTAGIDTNWSDYPDGSNDMSLTWWMLEDTAWNDGVVCSYGNSGGGAGSRFTIQIASAGTRLRLGVGTGFRDWTIPSDSIQHHYCMQMGEDATSPRTVDELELYIDGVLQTPIGTTAGTTAIAIEKSSPEATLKIGVFVDGATSVLDDTRMTRVAFFDKTLTLEEIDAQFLAGDT